VLFGCIDRHVMEGMGREGAAEGECIPEEDRSYGGKEETVIR
jgi:hypothetical protein